MQKERERNYYGILYLHTTTEQRLLFEKVTRFQSDSGQVRERHHENKKKDEVSVYGRNLQYNAKKYFIRGARAICLVQRMHQACFCVSLFRPLLGIPLLFL